MKRLAWMRIKSKNKDELQYIFDLIKNNVVLGKVHSDNLEVRIYEDTEEYKILLKEIKERNLRFTFFEGREYTKAEIKNSTFFNIDFAYPWEHDPGKNAEEYGTQFSKVDACMTCGRGKIQKSELMVDLKKVIKHKIATIIPEIMVSSDVRKIIEDSGLTGVSFGDVKDYKGREMPPYYQMFIHNVLPKMSDEIRVEIEESINRCKTCRTGGLYLRSEAIYEKEKLINALDFNLTDEYFWSANYCQRELMVSAKVRDVLNKFKIKFSSEPVAIR